MSLNRSLVLRTLIGIAIAVAMVGCSKVSSEIKVNDSVFVQPWTISYGQGQPFNPGAYWAEATVTAVKGDSVTIKPGAHWSDVGGSASDSSFTVSKAILVKKMPVTAKQVKIGLPVIARQTTYDTTYVYIVNGTVTKVEGDSFSVGFLFDRDPETTKVVIKNIWKHPLPTK